MTVTKAQAIRSLHSQSYFERNDGQIDGHVLYEAHGLAYSAFLTQNGATLVLPAAENSSLNHVVRLSFHGAHPNVEVEGVDKLAAYSNYFSGSDPKKWHTRVPQFARVRYRNAYPGIDVIFYVRDGRLEYDFEVAPGADPEAVRMNVEGSSPRLASEGDVVLAAGNRELIRLKTPQAGQAASQRTVSVAYSVHGQEVRFVVGQYDHRETLVIDPALIFSTFVTSNVPSTGPCDFILGIAVDSTGIYLVGHTCASVFPFTTGEPEATVVNNQTFVTKLDPSGAHVIYSTFLAGSGESGFATSLAVDNTGAVYLAGAANFPPGGFPTTPGAFMSTGCKFVQVIAGLTGSCNLPYTAKISPDGASLVYSTFLQGASGTPSNNINQAPQQSVGPEGIAIDDTGSVYIAGVAGGQIGTNVLPPPVPVGAFQTLGNLFALKLNPTATAFDYLTLLDGPSKAGQNVVGIAVDSSGAAYVAGSATTGYPTTAGALLTSNPAPSGFNATFVTKLSADGGSQVYSTYVDPLGLGGSQPFAFALDSSGEVVIAGQVDVTTDNPPGGAFLTKLNATGSALVYSKNLATTPVDELPNKATTVAVDSSGAAYVGGFLITNASAFPLLNPIQGYIPGVGTVNIAAKFDSSGSLVWSTFLGTVSNFIDPFSSLPLLAVDAAGNAYLVGFFGGIIGTPGTIDPNILPPNPRTVPAMLVKIAPSLGSPVPQINPFAGVFPATVVGTSAPGDFAVGNFGDASMSPVVSIAGPFSQTNNCSPSVPGGQKCDITIEFTPTAAGLATGTLTVSFGGSAPTQTIPLSGTGLAPTANLPSSVNFPPQAVGIASIAQNVSITNNGSASLSITSIQTSGDFSQNNGCGQPVAVGSSCTVQVAFTPTAMGSRTGSLTVTDNAPGSPQTVSLNGTGTGPGIGLAPSSPSGSTVTVSAGGTATYSLSIGGQGMSGTATLSCTGAPTAATCTVPGSMTFNSNTPVTFKATVTTTPRTTGALRLPGLRQHPWVWAVALMGAVVVSWAGFPRKRQSKGKRLCVITLGLLALSFLCSCGGGNSGGGNTRGTPAGTFNLTVTAASGSSTQSTSLTLTVQ